VPSGVSYRPVYLRSIGRFAAADPWNGNRPAEFTIEEYVMMPEFLAAPDEDPRYLRRARLRSVASGFEYAVPDSLIELWRRSEVSVQQIPALAQAIAPMLTLEDSNQILGQSMKKALGMPIGLTFGLSFVISPFIAFLEGFPIVIGLAISAGLTFIMSAIVIGLRQAALSRREQQMKWLLAAAGGSGAIAVPPDGKAKGRLMMLVKFYIWMTVCMVVIGVAVAVWHYVLGGKLPSF
jgi:hypothetical protein